MEMGTHSLKCKSKLRDPVPVQIVMIVWLGWTGFAANQGSTQVVLWFLAIMLFYLALAPLR